MDNDDMRRGKPSCHAQYGYADAVLTGDYLLNCCAEILLSGNSSDSYMDSCRYMLSCGRHMIEGQYIDIKGVVDSYDTYCHIAHTKTGALLRASLVCPAIYYNMSNIVIDKLTIIGNNLGLMYQISDDLADVDRSECSILNMYSVEQATALLHQLHDIVVQNALQLEGNGISIASLSTLINALDRV